VLVATCELLACDPVAGDMVIMIAQKGNGLGNFEKVGPRTSFHKGDFLKSIDFDAEVSYIE
jgi:hypothetical protein